MGADGTAALATSTGTGDAAVNAVQVLRAGQSTPTTLTATGTYRLDSPRPGGDGTVALLTSTVTGDATVTAVQVLRAGQSTPTTFTATGYFSYLSSAEGAVTVDTRTTNGNYYVFARTIG